MIGCRALRLDANVTITYYISYGYAMNTIFAYKESLSDGRIFVKHYFKNVSVVDGISDVDVGSASDEDVSDAEINVAGSSSTVEHSAESR